MSKDLTEPLIGEKSVSFADDRKNSVTFDDEVRASGVGYPLDGPRTTSTDKHKSYKIGQTRFGSSTTAEPQDLAEDEKRNASKKELKTKDDYLKKNGKEEFIAEYGEDEYKKLYVCDDEKECCTNCVAMGGKKTKRRKYTKKQSKRQRSRKSRRSKKGSGSKNKLK
jgi:hypothetical protein